MLRATLLITLLFALFAGCTETRETLPDAAAAADTTTTGTTGDTSPADVVESDPDEGPTPTDTPDTGDGDGDEPDAVDDVENTSDTGDPPDTSTTGAPQARPCVASFEYVGSASSVHLAGEFNEWSADAAPLAQAGDVWTIDLDTTDIAPGSYAYKFVVNGGESWQLDAGNPMRKHSGGVENSKVIIEDCALPLLELETVTVTGTTITAKVRVWAGKDGGALTELEWTHGFDPPTPLEPAELVTVTYEAAAAGKHTLRFDGANAHGEAVPLYLPTWVEDEPFDWSEAVLYFAMTDRFKDGDPSVGKPDGCLPADNKANWLGGDWEGVRQKLEEGYFDKLGVDAIWLTAFVDNPSGCLSGNLGKTYTSYHGYFPASQLAPEEQLGSMEDLQAMVAAAHARGIRVVVDLVANHLHDSHPFNQEHPDWFNAFIDCKSDGNFDKNPLTCWFEGYTPDLNYEQDGAVEEMTEAALWWVLNTDVDAFRIDAVKHMQDNFLRTLRWKIQRRVETVPGALFWMVGETFTGDWEGGNGKNEGTIKKYIAPHMLHGQFDFPLYWRIVRVFARDEESPLHLADLLTAGDGYYGSQALMSNFLGNHDVPRFISHAAGQIGDLWGNNAKQQGWDNPPGQPSNAEPYERLKLAFSFMFAVKGAPLIYYGDEIGMPGAGDPDNRRMMWFDGWSAQQQAVFDHVGALAAVRKAHPSLANGAYKTLKTDDAVLAFERSLGDDTTIVVLNRSGGERTVTVGAADGQWSDALGEGAFTASGGSMSVSVPAWGARFLSK